MQNPRGAFETGCTKPLLVELAGVEPATLRLKAGYSDHLSYNSMLEGQTGFEPVTSCLTGTRSAVGATIPWWAVPRPAKSYRKEAIYAKKIMDYSKSFGRV